MSNIPAIISTDVINSKWDVYWNELPEALLHITAIDTVIITLPFNDNSAEQVQLEKMMGACRLDKTQYATLQLKDSEAIAWHKIKEAAKPKQVLLLGVTPMQLGISAGFHLYYPNRFDETIFIASLSLSDMEQQPESKKRLWVDGLKPVFVDNVQQ